MKSLYQLLPLLCHDKYRSGQVLAGQLEVSRATIHNWVAELTQLGVEINSVQGRGYRLVEAISLLDRQRIFDSLSPAVRKKLVGFDLCIEVSSTNQQVLNQSIPSGGWALCVSEYQHQGRGRRGRLWRSSPASNIMMSLAIRQAFPSDVFYAISLVVGVAVARAIAEVTMVKVGLKWPNDIYYQDHKLGGVLCEIQGNPLDEALLVIGIGINVNKTPVGLDQPARCLADLIGESLDRNVLLIALLNQLDAVLQQLMQPEGLGDLLIEWRQYDVLYQREVMLIQGEEVREVTVFGIDERGQLKVQDGQGPIRHVSSGEVSIRC